jgi:spore coat polysaccharide biosynthesis protein SpsF (cytidylyltransferase family)
MPTKPTNTEERLDKHDRQIAAIRELIHEGMRLVIDTRKDFRVIAAMQKATAAAQKNTDASLKALIESLGGGGNGHTNGKTKRQ